MGYNSLKIALLISGNLGFKILKHLLANNNIIEAVFTDKNSKPIIESCIDTETPVFIGNPRNGKAKEFISNIYIDVILSINYLFLIESDLLELPSQYAVNFHGSLLPKYKGRTPHVWAIINGEDKTGITAHLMDTQVDNGPIVDQIEISIHPENTGGEILDEFCKQMPILVDRVINDIANKSIKLVTQEASKATYFGKRTPNNGQINWNWSKERIKNWIRAQAHPYPGAFTYLKNQKIVIHRGSYHNLGFNYQQKNGTILFVEKGSFIVKTPNGSMKIDQFETVSNRKMEIGDTLTSNILDD